MYLWGCRCGSAWALGRWRIFVANGDGGCSRPLFAVNPSSTFALGSRNLGNLGGTSLSSLTSCGVPWWQGRARVRTNRTTSVVCGVTNKGNRSRGNSAGDKDAAQNAPFPTLVRIVISALAVIKAAARTIAARLRVRGLILGCLAISSAIAALLTQASPAFASAGVGNIAASGTAAAAGITFPSKALLLRQLSTNGVLVFVLLSISAFMSLAETSITTLWPWKVRELAEKEGEGSPFTLVRRDVSRFLTTILISTTVAQTAATAIFTDAATELFGEMGVSWATAVLTVVVLIFCEITPKSVAVQHSQTVARAVIGPVAFLSYFLFPVGRVITFVCSGFLNFFGIPTSVQPLVSEEELKLVLSGAASSSAIQGEEQSMIEAVLDLEEMAVKEIMTPLVDMVAVDGNATLNDLRQLWIQHQYSRVPVYQGRIDNVVGVAYAMDLLDFMDTPDLMDNVTVMTAMVHSTFFVPESMTVSTLLREFRIRQVHMAVVVNEYGGTAGVVTLEDVVEEIVGEIFDETDSKEEIRKKAGSIVEVDEGVYDVDADTAIEMVEEAMQLQFPESDHETMSGFVCSVFGYIPRCGESILATIPVNMDVRYAEAERTGEEQTQEHFRITVAAGNARKVRELRMQRLTGQEAAELKGVMKTSASGTATMVSSRGYESGEAASQFCEDDVGGGVSLEESPRMPKGTRLRSEKRRMRELFVAEVVAQARSKQEAAARQAAAAAEAAVNSAEKNGALDWGASDWEGQEPGDDAKKKAGQGLGTGPEFVSGRNRGNGASEGVPQ
eukprot:jgi/Mesvir1/21906/Mv01969-RA.1